MGFRQAWDESVQLVGVRHVAVSCGWRAQNKVVVIHDSTDLREATVFRAPAAPQEALDNPTEGWRQSNWKYFYSMIGKELQQDHRRTQEVLFRRRPRSNESGRLAPGNKVKESGKAKKANVLWAMKEARDRGVDYYGTNHRKEIQTRSQLEQSKSAIHLKSPTAALAEAMECLAQSEKAPPTTNEW